MPEKRAISSISPDEMRSMASDYQYDSPVIYCEDGSFMVLHPKKRAPNAARSEHRAAKKADAVGPPPIPIPPRSSSKGVVLRGLDYFKGRSSRKGSLGSLRSTSSKGSSLSSKKSFSSRKLSSIPMSAVGGFERSRLHSNGRWPGREAEMEAPPRFDRGHPFASVHGRKGSLPVVDQHFQIAFDAGAAMASSSSGTGHANVLAPAPESVSTLALGPPLAPLPRADNMDVERGSPKVEHFVINVQGMTCVGCETKLHRSLKSLPQISNIKTSLLSAQAEFDLTASSSVHSGNVVKLIERMTGFTCTKMAQSGTDLDLIFDFNPQALARKGDLPHGITDLVLLNETTIRVTYHPKIIGARDLLSDPFFRGAKLGPVAARPLIASGRLQVRSTFIRAIVSVFLTLPVLFLAWAPFPEHEILYGGISLVLATIIQTVIAAPFYINALRALVFSQLIEMDLLVVLSTTTAYVYSVVAYAYLVVGSPLPTKEFFETSTLLVTLILIGRTVISYARQKALESISVESLQQRTALHVDRDTHVEKEIDARLLQYQDRFRVLPDTYVVTDGIVMAGETQVNESLVTGETKMVTKKPGMAIIAGSVNHSGTIIAQVTRLPHENTIKTIGIMVDEAKSSKPKVQHIADRAAGVFVPMILVITMMIFIAWVIIGTVGRNQSASTASIVAMSYTISALVVSCPCAIGLAVPMVVLIAGAVGAQHGVLFKSADTIEIARKVSHVVFDKTGTLTQGNLSVVAEHYPIGSVATLARMVMGMTRSSKHPVSVAIAIHMKALGIRPSTVKNVKSVVGEGLEAYWKCKLLRAGNARWLSLENSTVIKDMISQGLTIFCVTMDGVLVAAYGLKDDLRQDALLTIQHLQQRSVKVSLISGDNIGATNSVAQQLGIPSSHVRARCRPKEKQRYVKELLKREEGIVMFVGDGSNDAVALAQASIGVHMAEGTDIAQSAADAVLMRPSLKGILILMDLSKAFHRRVVFNFIWSFFYNTIAIVLAAGILPNDVKIAPKYAGLGELVSVLPVIAVAMQLRWVKF